MRWERALVGVGFLLMAAGGYAAGLLTLAVGFIALGRREAQGLFKATGVVLLITFLAFVYSLFSLFSTIFSPAFLAGLAGGGLGAPGLIPGEGVPEVPIPPNLSEEFSAATAQLLSSILVLLLAVVLGLLGFILVLASLFRASSAYGLNVLKYSAYALILAVVLGVAGGALAFFQLTAAIPLGPEISEEAAAEQALQMFQQFMGSVLGVAMLASALAGLACALAAAGFLISSWAPEVRAEVYGGPEVGPAPGG
ncbi:MAG: hypothetical protein DRO06_01745 [Thermoproteota archaeon]|nr:MAG: hypothetical protein DRO06_01745 [Candidatus Korarchaeota archaeon]